jgi:hypothetical protein
MAKIVLNDISNITGNPTSAEQLINDNFAQIETAIENTLSRDGLAPNALEASLDANSHRIVNLPFAATNTEPVTLAQVMALVTGEDWTGGTGIPAVVYYQEEPPNATAYGQVWVKPSSGEIYIWNGVSWVKQVDNLVNYALEQSEAAVAAASAATSTANTANTTANTALSSATDLFNTVDALGDSIDLISPRLLAIEQDVANVETAIIDLENEDITLAGQITLVTADYDDLSAAVQNEIYARIQGDTALASAIQEIQVSNSPAIYIQASAPVAGVDGVPNPIVDGSIWYESDNGNKQYRWLNGMWNDVTDANIGTLYASISSEQSARIAGDSALALDITALQVQRDSDYAIIQANNTARISADTALANSINGLEVQRDDDYALIVSNNLARISADDALSSSISAVSASVTALDTRVTGQVNTLTASVANETTARVNGDSANASAITAVNTTVNSLSTTVSQHTTSINGIQGRWTVQIDNNGYVSGVDLISNADKGTTPYSTFTVTANAFRIVSPGLTPVVPFEVVNGVTYIKNVKIDTAAIGTATIDTLQIKNNGVSDVFTYAVNHAGASGGAVTANVYTNLVTSYGTPAVSVTGIATGSKVHVRAHFNAKRAGDSGDNVFVRIRRNDGVVLTSTPQFRLTADWDLYAWEWIDPNPVSTTHTYTMQVMRPSTKNNCGDWEDITLIAALYKR